ncbi:MAG: alpha/beta fold hydrolase [Nostocoides sp.]
MSVPDLTTSAAPLQVVAQCAESAVRVAVAHPVGQAAALAVRGIRAMASPSMIAGTVAEATWVVAHLLTYPFGLAGDTKRRNAHGYGIEHLPPVQRGLLISDLEAAGTPILLVHGLVDNRSIFTLLRKGLLRRGFGQVSTMNYNSLRGDVRTIAARLAEEVEALVAETGYERIHIIGHSLGGLVARYYVTRLGGDERVHTLVTLGAPHSGTYAAYAWPSALGSQLRPGSGLVRELQRPAPGCATRFIAYWSDLDEAVLPHENAAIAHPDLDAHNVKLHGVGHVSLPIIGNVVHGISTALAHLDSDGRIVTPGVSVLPRHAAPVWRSPPSGLGV